MAKVIDAHMHMGEDLIYNSNDGEETILGYMQEFHIDGVILQPGLRVYDWHSSCIRIRDFAKAHPGRAWGIVSYTPHCSDEEYFEHVSWAINELGFVAIKLHPEAYCCAPNAPQARKVYEAARALNVPVMIHTGNGVASALPSLAIAPAREYPDLTFVLAHAGGGMFGNEALVAASVCPNIYLETSWCPVYMVKSFVQQLGCDRLMFGTDNPDNVGVELAKHRALHLSDDDLALCLGGTAEKVFHLTE
ncbi:MAG: amidohydrolase family protein [Lachnospiraceae bacterium]|nr:amidohydrolase family protein [Lachnospiraceae bacterium]